MIKIRYNVIIWRSGEHLLGLFQKVRLSAQTADNGKKIHKNIVIAEKVFQPTTFLIDLCNVANSGLSQKDMRKFFGFYERYKPQIDTLQLLNYIKKFLAEKNRFDVKRLEKIKVLTSASYEYSIWVKDARVGSSKYIPYVPFPDTDIDIFSIKDNFQYRYICNTIYDMIYAVFHYLALHNYKIAKCRHCGRQFMTTNLRNTLCIDRKTPYTYITPNGEKKYSLEDKCCRDAVGTIKSRFRQRRKVVGQSYDDYYDSDHTEKRKQFENKASEYVKDIRISPSEYNLKEYEKFLFTDNHIPKEERRLAREVPEPNAM